MNVRYKAIIPRSRMTRRGFFARSAAVLGASPAGFSLAAGERASAGSNLTLAERFLNPPGSARPGAYWIWVNGNFDLAAMTRELEDMKAKGMSGCEIFDCGTRDPGVPAGPPFMGPESVKAIAHAIREATRLGLELGLITSSSWNAGGPWVTPEFASKTLYSSETVVNGPGRVSRILPYPEIPAPKFKGYTGAREWQNLFSLEVAVLAFPNTPDRTIRDLSQVADLTSLLDTDGRLTWDAPPGDWVVLRCVCANNRERLAIPSPNSDGFMIDHLDARATEMHFAHIIDHLSAAVGDFRGTALKYLYLPSYEIRGTTEWTPGLAGEFRKRCGYDLTPFLPGLFGWTVRDTEIVERFQHDWCLTISDLLIENHYRKAAGICHQYGLELHAEAGGPGAPVHDVPVEALRALGALDVPRGEFWNKPEDSYDPVSVLKEIACAAHIYGKKLVEMESFTSWFHWMEGPFDLKRLADRAFCEGTNRFVFHTMPHHPPGAGLPGYAYGAGTHVGVTRVWWPKAGPFIDYLARGSSLLQQGLFVADVCFYYGGEAPNFVPNKRVDPSVGFGYDYDFTNTEVLLERMSVRAGKLALPDGMSYEILVLPERDAISLEVLQKLEKLVISGASIIGPRPHRSSGLPPEEPAGYRRSDEQIRSLADRLWGPVDGKKVTQRSYGKGKIIWGRNIRDVLRDRGVVPDFTFTSPDGRTDLDFVHRRTQQDDIYFVRNRRPRWEEVDCVFRVRGKGPELWEPDTGRRRKHHVYSETASGTKLHLRFPPHGSQFVVFRGRPADHVVSIRRNDKRIFPVSAGEAMAYPSIEVPAVAGSRFQCLTWEPGLYLLETDGGRSLRLEIPPGPEPMRITGPWEVRFPERWGAPRSVVFPRLISWTSHHDDGIRYFSGTAGYHKTFDVPGDLLADGRYLVLDLGRLAMVADVSVNDQRLGILWRAPFRVEVSRVLRPGKNRLRVEVANSWNNRLVGDAQLPSDKRYTRTNITEARRGHPGLMESGLIGPVQIIVGMKREI